ncbi:hypothetical protein N2152v2_003715 [Parachlorella kessleri]
MPQREVSPLLTARSSHEDVLVWCGSFLEPQELGKVIAAFKSSGETTDGQALLASTEETLRQGWGLPVRVARKIYNNLPEPAEASSPHGSRPAPAQQAAVSVKQEPGEAAGGSAGLQVRRSSRRRSRAEAALAEHSMPLASPPAGYTGATTSAGAAIDVDEHKRVADEEGEDDKEAVAQQAKRRQLRMSGATGGGRRASRSAATRKDQEEQAEGSGAAAHAAAAPPQQGSHATEVEMDGDGAGTSSRKRAARRQSSGGQHAQQQRQRSMTPAGPPARRRSASQATAGVAVKPEPGEEPVGAVGPAGPGAAAAAPGAEAAAEGQGGRGRRRGQSQAQNNIQYDVRTSTRRGLEAIFNLSTMDKLRELVRGIGYNLDDGILGRKVKREGEEAWVEYKRKVDVAARMAKWISYSNFTDSIDNNANEDVWRDDQIKEFLRENFDEEVRAYVDDNLRLQFAATPENCDDPHELMWKLWNQPVGLPAPLPPGAQPDAVATPTSTGFPLAQRRAVQVLLGAAALATPGVLLGTITLSIASMGPSCTLDKDRMDEEGTISWERVYAALEEVLDDEGHVIRPADLTLVGQDENMNLLFVNLDILNHHPRLKVRCKVTLYPPPGQPRQLKLFLYQGFVNRGSVSVLPACFEGKGKDGEDVVFSVDLGTILCNLDHLAGAPVQEQIIKLQEAYDAAQDQVLDAGLDSQLEGGAMLNLKQFDKIMGLVEDLDRPEPADLAQRLGQVIKLPLRPYQRRAVAFMLGEELAQGGSARNLWVPVPLPNNPEMTCYASPILHQLRVSTSKTEAEQAVGVCGGSGWLALQMGMGKTACAIGTLLLNREPEGWRAPRQWQEPSDDDYLASVVNNMPRGGTLIIAPPSLLMQWQDEFEKTCKPAPRAAAAENGAAGNSEEEADSEEDEEDMAGPGGLNILDWADRAANQAPREQNCREIASYDVVLTTPIMASSKHLLNNIYWHRIIVDEAQLAMGGFLADKGHLWFANHRWIMTGTPINASVDTISPSLEFLRLGGGYSDAFKFLPPVMAHVLQGAMVRYTKDGVIDGETNLPLPVVTERTLECTLTEEDDKWYDEVETHAVSELHKHMRKHTIDPDDEFARYAADYEYKKGNLPIQKLRKLIDPLRKTATGALKHGTGDFEEAADGRWKEIKYITQSKAQALIDDLEELKDREPDSKILIFSEYPDALRQVQRLLPTIGLQHRSIVGAAGGSQTLGRHIRAFLTDPPTKVFLLSYRAASAGITLTVATHVYLLEPALNATFEKQAIGRTVRMGQNKPVTVTRVVMQGTIEERVRTLLATKRASHPEDDQFASTLTQVNPAANDATTKLSLEDLQELLEKPAPAVEMGDNM